MADRKMHVDEVHTDAGLVRRLLAAQFPEWAALSIERVASSGTDNALYQLGNDMVVRLPRIHRAVGGVRNEQEWLPKLAQLLPVAIPVPLAKGEPGEGYEWQWSVYRWLEGEHPVVGRLAGPVSLAIELAQFMKALHGIDPAGGPPARRGVPLSERDVPTRAALAELEGMVDVAAVTAAWDAALQVPAWTGTPLWVHGDLSPQNLLCVDGRLNAVIDWGGLGVGDPACDLLPAWNLLPADARNVFRAALGVDDATWERGRGWALSTALIALPYYKETNLVLAESARHKLRELFADPTG